MSWIEILLRPPISLSLFSLSLWNFDCIASFFFCLLFVIRNYALSRCLFGVYNKQTMKFQKNNNYRVFFKTEHWKYNKPIKSRVLMKWKQKQKKRISRNKQSKRTHTQTTEAAYFDFLKLLLCVCSTLYCTVHTYATFSFVRKFRLRTIFLLVFQFYTHLGVCFCFGKWPFTLFCMRILIYFYWAFLCKCFSMCCCWFTLHIEIACECITISVSLTVKTWYIHSNVCSKKKR